MVGITGLSATSVCIAVACSGSTAPAPTPIVVSSTPAEATERQAPTAKMQDRQRPDPVQKVVAYRLQNYEPPDASAGATGESRLAGFRVVQSVEVADPALRDELISIFSKQEGFNDQHPSCFYPEMAFSFSSPPGRANPSPTAGPAIVLVSFSCNKVESRGFLWPFSASGIELATLQRLANLAEKLFERR